MKDEESGPAPTVLYISVSGVAAISNEVGSTRIPVLVEYGWNNATESLFVRKVVRQDAGHFGERLV